MRESLIVTAMILIASIQATAQDQSACLDKNLIKQISSQIRFETKDKDQFDLCNPNTNTYKIYEALATVRTITFNGSSLGKPYSQGILPNDFWGYFSKRANVMLDEGSCGQNFLAYVYGQSRDGVVHLCPLLYESRFTKFERAEVMLHEVRHFEGYSHVTCIRGPRTGVNGACDDSADEKGSYAVTVESLTKMAMNAKNISHTQKTMLKVLALTYADEVFNTPIQARDLSAFYLVGANNRGYMYSDKGLIEVANVSNAKLISRTSTLAVFPNDKSDAYTADVFTTSLAPSPAMGTFSTEYNNMPTAQRPEIVDIMNLGYLSASVTSRQIKTTLQSDTTSIPVELPWAAKAVYSGQEVGSADNNSLYVVNDKNEMYRLQFSPDHSYKTSPVNNPLGQIQAVLVFNKSRLALDNKGQVLSELNGGWTNFAPLRGKVFTKITRPFLWDQYFEDGASL